MHKYQPEGTFDWLFAEKARSMPNIEASGLRKILLENPNDFETRRTLFERYSRGHSKSILPHLLWFIDNHPKNAVLQFTVWARVDDVYRKARKHWLAKVYANPDDVTILCHAAQFVEINEPLLAAKFLQKTSEIDTFDEELPRRLSHVFRVKAMTSRSRARYYLLKSIEQMNLALTRFAVQSDEDSYLQTYFNMELSGLADSALEANLLKEASELAEFLLRYGEIIEARLGIKQDLNSPFVQRSKYSGHSILAVIALHLKDISGAKMHLLLMRSLINQQLPNDKIVEGLLKLGEFDLTMEYLGQIHKYWRDFIEQGPDPNFFYTNKDYPKSMEEYMRKMISRIRREFPDS